MIEPSTHKYFPWFTTLFSLLLVTVYAVMAVSSGGFNIDLNLLQKFGAPYAIQIYSGHVYGVIFNNLIHINLFHLLVNLIGLWLFGAFLERRLGWFKMAALGLVCSIFGSMIQLTMSDDAGLGISSALFGFYTLILILSFKDERFKMKFIYLFGAILLLFLIVMIFNNELFGEQVAIEAKIGGILWGLLMGISQKEGTIRWQSLMVLFIPFAIASFTLVYAPWSSEWQCAQGIKYHKRQELDAAERHYKIAVRIDPKNKLAQKNYTLIRVDKLSILAYSAHKMGEYTMARRYYLKILALKKNHRWAIDNLKELP